MDIVKRLEPLSLLLVMLVALNWAIVALFDWNAISEIFGAAPPRTWCMSWSAWLH